MATYHDEPGLSYLIEGTVDPDRILGRGGHDLIRGLEGRDRLFGQSGRDTLDGGSGNDILTGDNSRGMQLPDIFVFGESSGRDLITDFDVARDMLQIQKGLNGIKNARDVLHHATQKGDSVVIDLGEGNKIILKNVDLRDLNKNPGEHFDVANL